MTSWQVEELGLIAELRERSMQMAHMMSQSGVDLSAAANAPGADDAERTPTRRSHQPQLELDVTSARREWWWCGGGDSADCGTRAVLGGRVRHTGS